MKKLYLLFVAVALCLCVSSCTKEDSIAGTKWLGTGDASSMELVFTSTSFQLNEVSSGEFVLGSYVYEPPIITFTPTSFKDTNGKYSFGGRFFAGSVNGRTLLITIDGLSLSFKKDL
ncbi:MAG: hypothetical protein IJ893_07455 [Bacteroidales bacterium]|nr:hypothetical protein [Bacteroidales bacterium]MBR6865272.1 hypothetical protein [Bacteroidales bacterium]